MIVASASHGVRSAMVSSNSINSLSTTGMMLLVSLVTGVPHGRGDLGPSSHLAVEVPDKDHKHVVEILQHGDIVRREAAAAASAHTALAEQKVSDAPVTDGADITQDGAVTVVQPANSKSEQLKLEELTE